MATIIGLSASQSQILSRCSPPLPPPGFVSSPARFKKEAPVRRVLVPPLKCTSSGPTQNTESEAQTTSPSSSSASLDSRNSMYNWSAGLGAIGLVETAYLTYLKLSDSDAFCPLGGGSCGDVLNSDFAVIFGVPLPLVGLVAYGFVTALSLQLSAKSSPFGISESYGRLLLLGSTTSMAAASAYFLYILSTQFAGASCSYCLMSALLSFSLFFISLKDVGLQEIQKVVGLQICIASLVVATLSASYSTTLSVPSSLANVDLPYYTTEIRTKSSPFALSLAKHLHSIGAKMYGAFWCSHCLEQKQMFGREASKLLDYVECFPDGVKTGTKMVKACADAKLEGFPTWIINGQVLNGEVELKELAEISGFNFNELVN
ncbi:hypothetical protein QUC31_002731 [Theobroma cacao]|uniref:Thiol-disulfide oxidoreductase LTO1 isoform X1 n=1 Tax=Theobroma cacao TaxID=3641 RepID=A0AB32VIT9_THECC|nr:PREDICTED: thiol-disulfide oxidoreductase LTO1 isoform X1 [Theobroma cacao]